jgi:hypothetical protein
VKTRFKGLVSNATCSATLWSGAVHDVRSLPLDVVGLYKLNPVDPHSLVLTLEAEM